MGRVKKKKRKKYFLGSSISSVKHHSETQSPLRKQAYANVLKILPSKIENFEIKILTFLIFLLKT